MKSNIDLSIQQYHLDGCSPFFNKASPNWSLSNIAGKMPIKLDGKNYRSSEHLYQAAKFPHYPLFQSKVLAETSGTYAKNVAKRYVSYTRADWDDVKIDVMDYSIRAKLDNNLSSFGEALLATGDRPIVEISKKDQFWGCLRNGDTLVGQNILGKLLTELREEL